MPRCRHLLDPLPERTPPAHDIEDFRLVPVNLNRARPKVVGRRVQIHKLSLHVFSSFDFSCPWNSIALLLYCSVILSGGGASRSEVPPQSKDPLSTGAHLRRRKEFSQNSSVECSRIAN